MTVVGQSRRLGLETGRLIKKWLNKQVFIMMRTKMVALEMEEGIGKSQEILRHSILS